MANGQIKQIEHPQNTGQLLLYIIKKVPERLLKALPMTIAFGVFGWLLHTYLLVFTNQGFNPDTWLGNNVLNVSGHLVSSTLLWSMAGALFPIIISFFRKGGNPFKTIASMVKMPIDIVNKSRSIGSHFLPYMCFACAVTLFSANVFSGVTSMVAGGIIMSSTLAFVTGRGSIFIQILRMIVSDIQMFILRKQRMKLDSESVFMIIGTSGTALMLLGLVRAFSLPNFLQVIVNYLWIALIILGIILLFNKGKVPKQFIFIIGFIGAGYLFYHFTNMIVFADDGGWSEAGGTLGGWIGSSGSAQAILSGLAPAIGGLIGSYVSGILGGLFDGFDPFAPDDISTPPLQQDTPPQQDVPPQQETPEEKAERLRLLDEQIQKQKEFEYNRRIALQTQMEIRNKALENKKRLEAEYAEHKRYEASLCNKYKTTPDKLMDVLRTNQGANEVDAQKWMDRSNKLDYAIAAAQITVVACDTAIDGLANVTGPVGKQIRAGYKVIKGTAVGASEAYATGESMTKGAASGLVKGGADAASDYIDSAKVKAGLAIGSEVLAGAITEGSDGAVKGLKNGIYNVGVSTITDKIGGGGYGNDVSLVSNVGGKTGVIITTASGQTITRIVSNNTAQTFVANKLTNQVIQSGVKGTSGLINELGAKPALTNLGVLPK